MRASGLDLQLTHNHGNDSVTVTCQPPSTFDGLCRCRPPPEMITACYSFTPSIRCCSSQHGCLCDMRGHIESIELVIYPTFPPAHSRRTSPEKQTRTAPNRRGQCVPSQLQDAIPSSQKRVASALDVPAWARNACPLASMAPMCSVHALQDRQTTDLNTLASQAPGVSTCAVTQHKSACGFHSFPDMPMTCWTQEAAATT